MKNKCFIGSLLITALILFGIWNHDSVARLVSGVVAHNHSSTLAGGVLPNLNITGFLSSSNSCESGFTRVNPNECRISDLTSFTTNAFVRDACTTIFVSSNARAIILKTHLYVRSNNAVALRFSQLLRWDTGTCAANTMGLYVAHDREQVASGIGADLNRQDATTVFYLPSVGSSLFLQFLDDAGNQGAAEYIIMGYYD